MTFVDFIKAFHSDTIENHGKVRLPANFIAMVLAWVQNVEETLYRSLCQGYVLAPILFSTMLSAMLTDAFQDCHDSIPFGYRFDDKLFNQ